MSAHTDIINATNQQMQQALQAADDIQKELSTNVVPDLSNQIATVEKQLKGALANDNSKNTFKLFPTNRVVEELTFDSFAPVINKVAELGSNTKALIEAHSGSELTDDSQISGIVESIFSKFTSLLNSGFNSPIDLSNLSISINADLDKLLAQSKVTGLSTDLISSITETKDSVESILNSSTDLKLLPVALPDNSGLPAMTDTEYTSLQEMFNRVLRVFNLCDTLNNTFGSLYFNWQLIIDVFINFTGLFGRFDFSGIFDCFPDLLNKLGFSDIGNMLNNSYNSGAVNMTQGLLDRFGNGSVLDTRSAVLNLTAQTSHALDAAVDTVITDSDVDKTSIFDLNSYRPSMGTFSDNCNIPIFSRDDVQSYFSTSKQAARFFLDDKAELLANTPDLEAVS